MAKEPDQPEKPPQDYTVGYRKPPKAHQFKPGQSGNPHGRPKGAPTLEDLVAREARSNVKLKKGSEVTQVSKLEALVRRIFQKAMEGDLAAARLIFQIMDNSGDAIDQDKPASIEMPSDESIQRMLVRFAHLLPQEKDEK